MFNPSQPKSAHANINATYHEMLRKHGHDRAALEVKFQQSLLDPAGQDNDKVTVADEVGAYNAFENPAYQNKPGRKTNYNHHSTNNGR